MLVTYFSKEAEFSFSFSFVYPTHWNLVEGLVMVFGEFFWLLCLLQRNGFLSSGYLCTQEIKCT